MSGHHSTQDRRVIPRWRSPADSLDSRELVPIFPQPVLADDTKGLEELDHDWKVHRTRAHAADLVGAALVHGLPEVGSEAARYLYEEPDTLQISLRVVVEEVLGVPDRGGVPSSDSETTFVASSASARVRAFRGRVRRYPRDVLAYKV